jgi:Tfp pilus assembly protein FimT
MKTTTLLTNRSGRAFTLVEMLMTIASSSIVLASLIIGGVALQRSFAAMEGYSIAQGDQLRVSDYIAMDVRRALTASVDNNNVLIVTIPNYYDANNDNPKWANAHAVAPSFGANGAIQYGAGAATIKYYQLASNFIREVNGTVNIIARNVSSFTVSPQDLTSSVGCSITFAPTFTYLPGPGPVSGTTVYSNTFLRNATARQ